MLVYFFTCVTGSAVCWLETTVGDRLGWLPVVFCEVFASVGRSSDGS